MREVPKRLQPRDETLRRLYLLSGNRCAFPDCVEAVVDENGTLAAQIAHIEAALPEAERFNEDSDNEARRAFENLLLLCWRHHQETNDVDKYPVETMRKMKSAHEVRFQRGFHQLQLAVQDWTRTNVVERPTDMGRLYDAEGFQPSEGGEHEGNVEAINAFADRLARLSLPARQILAIVVDHGTAVPATRGEDLGILWQTLLDKTGEEPAVLRQRVAELETARLAFFDPDAFFDEFPGPHVTTWHSRNSEWPFAGTIQNIAASIGCHVADLLVDLRFDLLDTPDDAAPTKPDLA